MKLWKTIRQVGEAGLALAALAVIPWLPRWAVLVLASGLGDLGRLLDPKLRRVAQANVAMALGASRSPAEQAAILRSAYRVFALMVLDLFWFARFTRRRLRRLVRFDSSIQYYHETRPAIIVTGHFGNWEIMGIGTALLGDPISSVATPLKNRFVETLLGRMRQHTGQRIETRAGAVRAMLSTLRRGGRIAALLDQNTLPDEGGVFVRFFGLPVPVSRAAATLSQHTGVPIVIAYCLVGPGGTYNVRVQPALHLKGLSEAQATQAILSRLESVIREHPGQWMWMYKRWKYIPAGTSAEGYPFYGRPTHHTMEPTDPSPSAGTSGNQATERRGP